MKQSISSLLFCLIGLFVCTSLFANAIPSESGFHPQTIKAMQGPQFEKGKTVYVLNEYPAVTGLSETIIKSEVQAVYPFACSELGKPILKPVSHQKYSYRLKGLPTTLKFNEDRLYTNKEKLLDSLSIADTDRPETKEPAAENIEEDDDSDLAPKPMESATS